MTDLLNIVLHSIISVVQRHCSSASREVSVPNTSRQYDGERNGLNCVIKVLSSMLWESQKNDGPGLQLLTHHEKIYTSHRPHYLGTTGVDVKRHCKGSSVTPGCQHDPNEQCPQRTQPEEADSVHGGLSISKARAYLRAMSHSNSNQEYSKS